MNLYRGEEAGTSEEIIKCGRGNWLVLALGVNLCRGKETCGSGKNTVTSGLENKWLGK